MAQAGSRTNEIVQVEGCLREAPGPPGKEYILAHAIMPEAEKPQGTVAHVPLVPPGSWVRLSPGSNDLKSYVGQRVSITGAVVDRGENTLGTSGRVLPNNEAETDRKFKQSARDAKTNPVRAIPPTTVAPMGANANGTAPRIAVEKVAKLADTCEAPAEDVPVGR